MLCFFKSNLFHNYNITYDFKYNQQYVNVKKIIIVVTCVKFYGLIHFINNIIIEWFYYYYYYKILFRRGWYYFFGTIWISSDDV